MDGSRSYRHIEAQPIAGALGAEIHGVDVARPLAAEVVAEIRQAFLDHLVILFRNQKLTPPALLAFAEPRLMKLLTRQGVLIEEQGVRYLAGIEADQALTPLQAVVHLPHCAGRAAPDAAGALTGR